MLTVSQCLWNHYSFCSQQGQWRHFISRISLGGQALLLMLFTGGAVFLGLSLGRRFVPGCFYGVWCFCCNFLHFCGCVEYRLYSAPWYDCRLWRGKGFSGLKVSWFSIYFKDTICLTYHTLHAVWAHIQYQKSFTCCNGLGRWGGGEA